MEKAKIAVLEAELQNQWGEVDNIYTKIAKRTKAKSSIEIESLAYQLHNLYCAYEDIFKVVADNFENNIEEGVTWHKELLRRMVLSIKGIRPNLISEEAFGYLNELKNFRHFFRHAYTYELDAEKIRLVLEAALKLKRVFKQDLDNFLQKL